MFIEHGLNTNRTSITCLFIKLFIYISYPGYKTNKLYNIQLSPREKLTLFPHPHLKVVTSSAYSRYWELHHTILEVIEKILFKL